MGMLVHVPINPSGKKTPKPSPSSPTMALQMQFRRAQLKRFGSACASGEGWKGTAVADHVPRNETIMCPLTPLPPASLLS